MKQQAEYAHWGMQIAQVCMYVHTHGMLPRRENSEGLPLASERTREQLARGLSEFIRLHELAGHSPAQKLETIVRATEDASKNRLSEVDDAVLLLATIINMSDVIAYDQRTLFADHPSMKDMVTHLKGMLVPVATKILGGTLPDGVSRAWPDFARLFIAGAPHQHHGF